MIGRSKNKHIELESAEFSTKGRKRRTTEPLREFTLPTVDNPDLYTQYYNILDHKFYLRDKKTGITVRNGNHEPPQLPYKDVMKERAL